MECTVPGTRDATVNISCPRGGTDAATPTYLRVHHHPGQSDPVECSQRARQRQHPLRNGAKLDIVDLVNDLPAKITLAGGSVQADLENVIVVVVVRVRRSRHVVSSNHCC